MSVKRAIYFDCFSGISGDMILGGFINLGVDIKIIRKELQKLNIRGFKLTSRQVKRNGITGTKVNVVLDRSTRKSSPARKFTDIRNLIQKSDLKQKVKSDSIEIFHRIGKVEAKIHHTTLNKVHFHEVGAIDSIVDIVGGAICMSLLNIDLVYSSPLNIGEGLIKCQHGVLPIPAPATLELLKGIPCYSGGIKKELTTPTGAAFAGYFVKEFRSLPKMHILNTGYGAGEYEVKEIPNLLRIVLGEINESHKVQSMKIIETNIDDMNPEFYEYIMDQLFQAGAVDVFLTPVYMKKNRPGNLLTVIVPFEYFDSVTLVILKETSTFGIRHYDVERTVLKREQKIIKTAFGKVRIKIGWLNESRVTVSPEYDDCRKVAAKKRVPIKRIYEEALRAARSLDE